MCHRRLAAKQNRCKTRHMTTPLIQRWDSNGWWVDSEGQTSYKTRPSTVQGTGTTVQLLHELIKTGLLACQLLNWLSYEYSIEGTLKSCSTCMQLQQTQPMNKVIPHYIQGKPLEIIGTDLLTINNNHFLCAVDFHSKYTIVKQDEGLSSEHLIRGCKLIFAEYGLLLKLYLIQALISFQRNSVSHVGSWI